MTKNDPKCPLFDIIPKHLTLFHKANVRKQNKYFVFYFSPRPGFLNPQPLGLTIYSNLFYITLSLMKSSPLVWNAQRDGSKLKNWRNILWVRELKTPNTNLHYTVKQCKLMIFFYFETSLLLFLLTSIL